MDERDETAGNLELNAIQLLKKELCKLEKVSLEFRKQLKKTKERLDKVNSSLHLTKQQIDVFTQESNRALEGVKDTNWQFTKELCGEIAKIKKPNSTLLEVSNKFMLILDQKDRSWSTFKAVMKNYTPLKSLMLTTQTQTLNESQVNELLGIWKNQQKIQYKLRKYCKGIGILAEWISYSVEYKLKKETLTSVELNYPDLLRKKNQLTCKISEINSKILIEEEKIAEVKMSIDSIEVLKVEEDFTDFSSYSGTSNNNIDERNVVTTPLHQGTASGGIMKLNVQLTPSFPRKFFPDFELNSDELYSEAPVKKASDEEIKVSLYEDISENLGCCRLKFFCF